MNVPCYYYRDGEGREIGPLPMPALAQLWKAGILTDDTLIRLERTTAWLSYGKIVAPAITSAATTGTPNDARIQRANEAGWNWQEICEYVWKLATKGVSDAATAPHVKETGGHISTSTSTGGEAKKYWLIILTLLLLVAVVRALIIISMPPSPPLSDADLSAEQAERQQFQQEQVESVEAQVKAEKAKFPGKDQVPSAAFSQGYTEIHTGHIAFALQSMGLNPYQTPTAEQLPQVAEYVRKTLNENEKINAYVNHTPRTYVYDDAYASIWDDNFNSSCEKAEKDMRPPWDQ